MDFPLNMKLYFNIFLLFLLSSCVTKGNPPEFVKLTDNITVHKSTTDETTGCTMYLPISKNNDIVKAVIYFVYFEEGNYIARPSINRDKCL